MSFFMLLCVVGFFFLITNYLFDCTRSWLWHTGFLIFGCGMQTLSCSMWDLVS